MKKRNPILVFVFSLITFNIYYLYWLASTRKELIEKTKIKIPSIWLMLAPVIIMFGLIAAAVALQIHDNSISPVSSNNQLSSSVALLIGLVYIMSFLVILPVTFYWLWRYCKAVEKFTKGDLSYVLSFVLLWLLGMIGAAILQDKYNNEEKESTLGTIHNFKHEVAPHHHTEVPSPETEEKTEPKSIEVKSSDEDQQDKKED